MSQPELDISDKFDIPSPPPVATNTLDSPFTFLRPSQTSDPINTQPDAAEPLTNSPVLFDVHKKPSKAPIASIPELQLDDKELDIPVQDNSSGRDAGSFGAVTHTESSCALTQTACCLPTNQPPIVVDTSDHKEPFNSVCVSSGARGNNILQESCTKSDILQTESSSVTSSCHQPGVPVIADSTTPSSEHLPESVGSHNYATITESHSVSDSDNCALNADSATTRQEFSLSDVERSIPETLKSASTTSTVSSEKSTQPVSQDSVYGELYDSLFPPDFTSEVISSVSNPLPEISYPNTKSELVMDKCRTETNDFYSHLSTSHEFADNGRDNSKSSYTETYANNKRKVVFSSESSRFTSHQSFIASDLQKESDHRYVPSSLSTVSEPVSQGIHYSELSHSHSKVKSDDYSLIQDTVRSVPEVRNSAPPVSGYITSQGKDTQVTDSKRRGILVRELVTDEPHTDPGCPSPVLDKMSTVQDLQIKTETPSGQMDVYEGFLSPAYLSVGSDDGSAMEIYYSAEEDNSEHSEDDDMYKMDAREDDSRLDGVKVVPLREEQEEIVERQMGKRSEGDLRVVIVKIQNEVAQVSNEEKTDDFSSQTEMQQQLRGQRADAHVHNTGMSEFLVSKDGKSQQKAVAATALPQMKEGEEGRKEDVLATPVEQVNTLMVCKVIPPSNEPHGQGEGSEGNWTQNLETEAHLNGEKQFPSQELQYLTYKDTGSSEYMHAASSKSRKDDVITPTFQQTEEEQVSEIADKSREVSVKSRETHSNTTTNAVSDTIAGAEVVTGSLSQSAELQSGAIEIEHNRAPRHSQWVGTITQSTDLNRTVQEQVAVELSSSDRDTHHPDTEAAQAISERHKHPPEAQPDLAQG